ncbi:MAG: class I SAM-dependent methyltransferase, partial [Patescibacteria group bacterium]
KENLEKPEPKFPLEAYWCQSCNLAQLIHVVDPEIMFRDYVYFTSGMPRISFHWQAYANHVMANFLSRKDDFVLEVGSNDGALVKYFFENGYRALGVDPARNIVDTANKNGIPTICDFFGNTVADKILQSHGKAKAILANNVFAHIDDHQSVLLGVTKLLHKDGVFAIEAPHILDMFENLAYDTIYHEHLSFLAVRPMQKFFEKFGLEIFDVKIVPAQGQSLRVFAGWKGAHKIAQSVSELINRELKIGLDKKESYLELARRIASSKENLLNVLRDLKNSGKRIAAYGAPAKGNTLLNYCKIGIDTLDYASDGLPSKVGLYTPGMHIPVVSKEYANANPPDYYLLLAWNYKDSILEAEKDSKFKKNGGKFIVPIGDKIELI